MKTLYSRFTITTICIMIVSGFVAFLGSNLYYQIKLKSFNDQKITQMTQTIVSFHHDNPGIQLDKYLQHISQLGYQIALFDEGKEPTFFGKPFRMNHLSSSTVDQVLRGEVYHGIEQFPKEAFVTGFFDDELRNTIGMPIKLDGKQQAVFLRPDIGYQFGEMRIFFAVLIALIIGLSVLFVLISTHYVVKPIRDLTHATKLVAQGEYDLYLPTQRKDEIGKLAYTFSQMAQSVKNLDEMRQEFVSNVSHEIQSPLTSIQGFTKTLQTEDLTREQQQRYLEIVESESHRLSVLSKQLLTLASLDKEGGSIEKMDFDLSDQIKQVIFMSEWQWREKDLTIEMELPQTMIHADPKLLYQVWSNLITNSVKFTDPNGTVVVKITSSNSDQKEVQVLFADTGIGIPSENLPYIFDRFYKVDAARTRNEQGTGLGLAIAKKIIDMHGGSIEVTSQEGEGAQFLIRLPV
ncbi:signal transduction histidine kinase [Croceifilum oryzae]|uniref:Heme sensor protein HssS n=1 Tax=Croceifilum oryzae TaxID=1553429 RepID=A0AAJ1TL53_9BACL|nr:HAMP domain-containing sensor histidine kinase [Croceifilum oryzae]MDQ0418897.1 signal transduction histidine kinase [Croceifilum oryzae]